MSYENKITIKRTHCWELLRQNFKRLEQARLDLREQGLQDKQTKAVYGAIVAVLGKLEQFNNTPPTPPEVLMTLKPYGFFLASLASELTATKEGCMLIFSPEQSNILGMILHRLLHDLEQFQDMAERSSGN